MIEAAGTDLEREIQELVTAMEAEQADFIAEASALGMGWSRARIERFVMANYVHTLSLDASQLAALRRRTDDLIDGTDGNGGEGLVERIRRMVANRDDIWMHRRLVAGRRPLFEYEGGVRLPERIRSSLAAALSGADRLLEEFGYIQPGSTAPAGFDPGPVMQHALRRYAELQPQLAALLARRDSVQRSHDVALHQHRATAVDQAGAAAARAAWDEASRRPAVSEGAPASRAS